MLLLYSVSIRWRVCKWSLTYVLSMSVFVSHLNFGSFKSNLSWVSGHGDIVENWIVTELAKAWTDLATFTYVEAQSLWQQEDTCLITRLWWTRLDGTRTNSTVSLKKMAINRTISTIVIGHYPSRKYAERLNIPFND